MMVIQNTWLFNRVMKSEDKWKVLFTEDFELIDENIPILAGGLDHIVVKENEIQYHDIGCETGSGYRDNSFTLRKDLVKGNVEE